MVVRLHWSSRSAVADFVSPLNETARTAILMGGFRETRSIRVFEEGWSERAAKFRPSAIAAPLRYLRKLVALAETIAIGHALVAFTGDRTFGISDSDRDLFWRAFGVPVFEQYLGSRHELLAAECEAHAGMHVVRACEHLPLDRTPCACGSSSPRLVSTADAVLIS